MRKEINEVIDFAIEREKESALFYRHLQVRVKNESSKKMLNEFEQMEWRHAEILQELDLTGIDDYKYEKIADLKISDYMVDREANDEMSFQEVLVIAMKREEAARRFYLELAESTDKAVLRNTFLRLSEEEAKHKLEIETIYDNEILQEN
jgi:rubrerythrin